MVILYFLHNTLKRECDQTSLKLIHLKKLSFLVTISTMTGFSEKSSTEQPMTKQARHCGSFSYLSFTELLIFTRHFYQLLREKNELLLVLIYYYSWAASNQSCSLTEHYIPKGRGSAFVPHRCACGEIWKELGRRLLPRLWGNCSPLG